jgi:hypothetical protein
MATWYTLRSATPSGIALELAEVLENLAPRMRLTQGETGGLTRARLVKAVGPALVRFDLTDKEVDSFNSREIDLWSAASGLAISLQTGRAHTNNGALVAVLAAAAHRSVDWLVLGVPEAYKGGAQAAPVSLQIGELLRTRGIALDLDGVALVAY